MTTIQTLQHELDNIQAAAEECVTEYGHIKSECRYKYQLLVNKARAMSESISWLEGQGIGQTEVTPSENVRHVDPG